MRQLYLLVAIFMLFLMCPCFAMAQNTRDIVMLGEEGGEEETPSERHAIIIGVEKYIDNDILNLEYSVDDAIFISEALERQGAFTVNLITDDTPIIPTKENILSAFDEIIEFVKMGISVKTLVFYFGGHGFNIDGVNYLVPTDARLKDITGSCVSLSEIFKKVKEIQKNNVKVMMFLDACRNDPTSKKNKKSGFSNDVWQDSESSGLKIMYSTSEGKYSYELDGHGIFTLNLVGGILGAADQKNYGGDANNLVSFDEVANYVNLRLIEWGKETGYIQKPRIKVEEAIGKFYLSIVDKDAFREPIYKIKPHLTSINLDGTKIEWETDKETYGKLYFGKVSNFDIKNSVAVFGEVSSDGKRHYAIIDYSEINIQEAYYYKTKDQDFIGNYILSNENKIEQAEIYNSLNERYVAEYNNKKVALLYYLKEEMDFKTAKSLCNDLKKLIELYEKILDLTQYKKEIQSMLDNLELAIEINPLTIEAKKLFDAGFYERATLKFKEILEYIMNNPIENVLPKKQIEEYIRRSKSADIVLKLIEEGDVKRNAEMYEEARKKYNQAIQIVERENIVDLISIEEIKEKIDLLPYFSNLYLSCGIGFFTNLLYPQKFPFLWDIGINFRLNRSIALGIGIFLTNIDFFCKWSLINTFGLADISHELLFKFNFLFDIYSVFFLAPGLGGGFALEYTLTFSKHFGISFGLGLWTLYHFGFEHDFNLLFTLSAGFKYHF